MNNRKISLPKIIMYTFIIMYTTYIIVPIFWVVMVSFKDASEIFTNPIALPEKFKLENYISAWNGGIKNYFLNSVIIAFIATVCVVLFSGMLSYALARLNNKWNKYIYLLAIMSYAVPMNGVIAPLYAMESKLGLLNNLIGVILPGTAFGIPFAVVVLYSFLLEFPREMEEAAVIDGAGHFRIFFQIVIPLARPAFITVIIFQIMGSWNDFLLPSLILTNEKVKPITVGLTSFQGQWSSEWGAIIAGIIISVIPMLFVYFIFQKYIVNSFGGMSKG